MLITMVHPHLYPRAAGRDVNIIEGIGIDPDLGSAVSVTVIATGFETKKVNDPITIELESNEFSKDNEKIENDFTIETTNSSHVQQTLSLEEDSLQDHSETIAQSNLSNLKEKGFQIEETSVLVEEKIVLELEEEDLEEDSPVISLDLEEKIEAETEEVNSEEFISDILNSEDVEVKNASIDNETVLNSDTENLTTANSMRVEARERENRLREISIKLRTPSGLTKLENEPAYKRSNILLDDTTHSSEEELSRLSLNNEGLQSNNKFLHDNVD